MRESLQISYRALAAEHEELILLLERLGNIRDGLDLSAPLEELHVLLARHFAHEQFPGGLYESLGAYGQEHRELVGELIREHCMLLSTASGLLDRSRKTGWDPDLLNAVHQLIDALHGHERNEHRLAEELLGSDMHR